MENFVPDENSQESISINDILRENWKQYLAWKEWKVRPAEYRAATLAMKCRTPALGCHIHECPDCGTVLIQPHSCKSPFCSTCGVERTNRWCDQLLEDLLPVHYRHLVFTIPWQLRLPIKDNPKELLDVLFKSAAHSVMALTGGGELPISKKARERVERMNPERRFIPGIIAVLHTFGNDLKLNQHIHLIVTAGGRHPETNRWIPAAPKSLVSATELGTEWKLRVVRGVREAERQGPLIHRRLRGDRRRRVKIDSLLPFISRFKWRVLIGESLEKPDHAVRYGARYCKRPVISNRRIVKYDGKHVTFKYKDHRSGKTKYRKMKVLDFLERALQHVPEKYARQVRYYGPFASRGRARWLPLLRAELSASSPAADMQPTSSSSSASYSTAPTVPVASAESATCAVASAKVIKERKPKERHCPNCGGVLKLWGMVFGCAQTLANLLQVPVDRPVGRHIFTGDFPFYVLSHYRVIPGRPTGHLHLPINASRFPCDEATGQPRSP